MSIHGAKPSPSGPVRMIEAALHELLVLKPAGLASELPRDPSADSLLTRLAAMQYSGLRLVHRLDAASCGLMLVARTAEAAAHYAREIADRRWHKWYVAQVGLPHTRAAALVGKHKSYLKVDGSTTRVVRSGGKPSFLDIALAAPAPDFPKESHLLIRLHTGRFHQIRAMLADRGAPLVGDTRYGGPAGQFYLEHTILGARSFGSLEWRVWQAPAHSGRPAWAPEMAEAVERCARELADSVTA